MRVLVCGGRNFADWEKTCWALDQYSRNDPPITIIQGGASGADFLAKVWAKFNKVDFEEYPADWKTYGYAAGGIRNQQMLDEGKPDLVVAFPGGNGTADMVRRAKKANIEVIEVGI